MRAEFDHASMQHLQAILQALQTLGKSNQGKLGQGKSRGQGEMLWQQSSLQILTKSNLKKWLNQNTRNKKTRAYKKQKAEKKLHSYFLNASQLPEIKELLDNVCAYSTNLQSLNILLYAQSPLLINDPHAVKLRAQQAETHPPDLIYRFENNQAIIPGSTLKGWARARCRRILLTIIDNHSEIHGDFSVAEKIADSLLQTMFGSTATEGCLAFNNARVAVKQPETHPQTFNAIDRFSGGVKDSALYKVEAIWPEKPFAAQLQYQYQKLSDWMKLLLLYLIKDAMQDDLVLGWGKSKGYGRLRLSLAEYPDWDSLYPIFKPKELQQWDNALQQALKTDAENSNAS